MERQRRTLCVIVMTLIPSVLSFYTTTQGEFSNFGTVGPNAGIGNNGMLPLNSGNSENPLQTDLTTPGIMNGEMPGSSASNNRRLRPNSVNSENPLNNDMAPPGAMNAEMASGSSPVLASGGTGNAYPPPSGIPYTEEPVTADTLRLPSNNNGLGKSILNSGSGVTDATTSGQLNMDTTSFDLGNTETTTGTVDTNIASSGSVKNHGNSGVDHSVMGMFNSVAGTNTNLHRRRRALVNQNKVCVPVQSKYCAKYAFNQTVNPFENYPGHSSVKEAEAVLGTLFTKISSCTIPRAKSESIACAMHIPLCLPTGEPFPPCAEDCEEIINGCRITEIPGYSDALGICTLFPSRRYNACFTYRK